MKESPELRNLLLGIYHGWTRREIDWVDRLVSADDAFVAIGTDDEEWYVGGRGARAILRRQVQEGSGGVFVPGELHAYEDGALGLIVDNPLVESKTTGRSSRERLSLVLRRERGAWTIIHWHQSIGVPNVEALGHVLTTSLDAVADDIERVQPDLSGIAAGGTITMMFTDIEGSTALNERLGDARWLPALRAHHERVAALTAEHGGTVIKSQGDGFMLAFPSARRALECAVALQRATVDERSEFPIRVRIGLHTGEPLEEDRDLFGRDVAFAARVGAAADGGQILVSSLVRSLVEASGAFAFGASLEASFKGFEGPQQVWEVVWR